MLFISLQILYVKILLLRPSVRPTLHKESRSRFNFKSRIHISAKVEISPKGFTLWFNKAEIEKNLFNMSQVTNKCWTLWPCIKPKAKKDYQRICEDEDPIGYCFGCGSKWEGSIHELKALAWALGEASLLVVYICLGLSYDLHHAL